MDRRNNDSTFVIGLIYEGDKVEALSLYNSENKKGSIESINTVKERLQKGEKIHGVHLREELRCKSGNFKVRSYVELDIMRFDYRKMHVLNGAGEIITTGKDVIIGAIMENDTYYCVVVNSNYELRKVKKEDAISQKLLGTFRNTILKVCQKKVEI